MVVATGGGAVGVMVLVMTWPVTVIMDVHGVAVQVLLDDKDVVGVVVGVVDVVDGVGMAVTVGVEEVDGGSRVIDTGINMGVVVVSVLVDVVEGV